MDETRKTIIFYYLFSIFTYNAVYGQYFDVSGKFKINLFIFL